MNEEIDWDRLDAFTEQVQNWFEENEEEFLEFEKIQQPRSRCRDIHAILLMEELDPTTPRTFMISGANHDEIYFDFALEKVMDTLTEELVVELIRCGVRFVDDHFEMFV